MDRTEQVFSQTAATYDAARSKLIPNFQEFYASAVSLLPDHTERVLDLGAGTGLLAAFVRERFPAARIEMVDSSRDMLLQAQTRFAGDQNISLTLGDYTTCTWGTSYDAVVSALSIHHLPDDKKQQLFTRILAALRRGGIFINAEQILQPTPELEHAAREHWLKEARALGATEQEVADSLLRQTEDRCATVVDQIAWLSGAGFVDVGCSYSQGRFAVLHGRDEDDEADGSADNLQMCHLL